MKFSHLKGNKLNMVDISSKKNTDRIAKAKCEVKFSKKSFVKLIKEGTSKGEIFNVSRTAGIMSAKRTYELIPLCHNLPISKVDIKFEADEVNYQIKIFTSVKSNYKTGVEMEALVACSIASLTIYDMCKSIDKSIEIQNLKLAHKSGGKSGNF